ncbi:NS7b protein [Night heron coronavirus HKU19]|uniref:NS7b protein n=1 Tax=Night heron coronavirus HKU19 TaxID=1159904 RepID=H9BR23_9NIDO|nr:NS7b gene product [Night heron coronavirus HKU19]AFD29232.1 NS7b protein [Night heron coronavirus HKU19]
MLPYQWLIKSYVNLFNLTHHEKEFTLWLILLLTTPAMWFLVALLAKPSIITCRHHTTAFDTDEQAYGTEILVDRVCLLVQRITLWLTNTARRLVASD